MDDVDLARLDDLSERLEIAVEAIATSGDDIRRRLVRAFESIFVFQSDQFPAGRMRTTFDEVFAAMTRVPAVGEFGSHEVTSHHLRKREAERIAKMIFDLYAWAIHELLMDRAARGLSV